MSLEPENDLKGVANQTAAFANYCLLSLSVSKLGGIWTWL
jgi:hypothetical protein